MGPVDLDQVKPGLLDPLSSGAKGRDVESALLHDGMSGPVVVYGSGSVALEVAWWLADKGTPVTVVSRSEELAADVQRYLGLWLARKLDERGVPRLAGHELRQFDRKTVLVTDGQGGTKSLEAEWLVVEAARRPNNKLGQALKETRVPHIIVGDALQPARLLEAIHGATAAALAV